MTQQFSKMKTSLFLFFCLLIQIGISQPNPLGSNINTTYDEMLPVISPDEKTLYFIRANHPENSHGETGSQDIWFSERSSLTSDWGPAKRMANPFNKRKYNSIYSVSPDGKQILLAGAYRNGRYMGPGVSISKKRGRNWSNPVALQIKNYDELANGKYSSAFMSHDNEVLILSFCSKKRGKKSKNGDLYVSFKQQNNNWSEPIELGDNINSSGSDEFAPFLGADMKTLFFASDRKGGNGSVDIYKTTRKDDSWKKWSDPVNLGENVNTEGYDAYYSIPTSGEFAYMVKYDEQADIVKVPLSPDQRPKPVALLTVNIQDSKTYKNIKGTLVLENAETGRPIRSLEQSTTDVVKTILQLGKTYKLVARSDGYESKSITLNLNKEKLYKEIKRNMVLSLRADKPQITESDASSVNGSEGLNTPGAVSDTDGTATTNGINGANNASSRAKEGANQNGQGNPLASSEVGKANATGTKVKVDDGIDSKLLLKDRIRTLPSFEELTPMPLNEIGVTPLFFQTNSTEINPAYTADLMRIVLSLNKNPSLKMVVRGHADDVGEDERNQLLSESRAEMVMGKLISLGVAAKRLKAVGYGETRPHMDNTSTLGRGVNRRVDFQLVRGKRRKK